MNPTLIVATLKPATWAVVNDGRSPPKFSVQHQVNIILEGQPTNLDGVDLPIPKEERIVLLKRNAAPRLWYLHKVTGKVYLIWFVRPSPRVPNGKGSKPTEISGHWLLPKKDEDTEVIGEDDPAYPVNVVLNQYVTAKLRGDAPLASMTSDLKKICIAGNNNDSFWHFTPKVARDHPTAELE
ncbi:hypothetical protein Clacol_010211 [Clathrus columnatus]|uniref:Uncharacterized protein n=1 Tax=Clathrus columnatus TaxID=1419009 RepID=A0AAV5AMM5_9AGAM|nr:hypothetical protein Clacol_010211 [Clathrus columnatus]